ncbi:MAG: hypothetical protein ACK463_16405, partial [Bradyrhizobium sp.]
MLTAAARQCLAVLAWSLCSRAPCFRETMKETEMFNSHSVEIDWGGRPLKLETGKIARQADGAVMATYGET